MLRKKLQVTKKRGKGRGKGDKERHVSGVKHNMK